MKEIGGYFELELARLKEYHVDGVKLNSARNCLRQLVITHGIKRIYVPAFTCPVVWEALEKENCEVVLYRIDDHFMPEDDLNDKEWILYTNYFGICDENVLKLRKKYSKLIVDQAQAFYGPVTENCFFSPRKFFGVPDGGILFSSVNYDDSLLAHSTSAERMQHLLQRIEGGASDNYSVFLQNEEMLGQEPVRKMSLLTERLLQGIDYENIKKIRNENFNYLHQVLKKSNQVKFVENTFTAPMVYPYLVENGNEIKKRLIENKIYVATYWKGQKDDGVGQIFEKHLVAIPIDQRYSVEDMQRIFQHVGGL